MPEWATLSRQEAPCCAVWLRAGCVGHCYLPARPFSRSESVMLSPDGCVTDATGGNIWTYSNSLSS